MHDRLHIGVNKTEVHTEIPPVVHQADHLAPTLNLPASGRDSGKGLKMVDLSNTGSWCEPRAVSCEAFYRGFRPIERTQQRPPDPLVGCTAPPCTVSRTPMRTVRHDTKPRPRRAVRAWWLDSCCHCGPITRTSRPQRVRNRPILGRALYAVSYTAPCVGGSEAPRLPLYVSVRAKLSEL